MEKPFSFGKNWDDFLRTSLTEQRVSEAMKSLTEFLGVQRLDGLIFLDVGSGSGLFSLAAHRLGAEKIISFDLDPFSVSCTEYLREKAGNPPNWFIQSGSILDQKFIDSLDRGDIVYSWGVLHHTGNIWKAIENATELVRPGGVLFISIYNNVEGIFGSRSWLKLKRMYNSVSASVRTVFEYAFLFLVISKMLLTLKNPIAEIRRYKERRGMSLMTDIRDSLGGYPYEYASAEEVFRFCRDRKLHLENLKTVNNLGLNEFLFRKKG